MNGMGQSGRELIDTLWNVNTLARRKPSLTGYLELIDTLWNVNSMLFRPDLYVTPELIDTLWNVNY